MKKLLAGVTALGMLSATACFGPGIAAADETPADGGLGGGNAYALGGAHVLGIPYDEYIRREGREWFPNLKRLSVDYPAGQVQGHALEEMWPGMGLDGPSVGESVAVGADNLDAAIRKGGPGMAIGLSEGAFALEAEQARLASDPSAPPPDQLTFSTFANPIARHSFGQSFLTSLFSVGTTVPVLDYRIPPPVESQYDTNLFVAAYDMLADFPDRPNNVSLGNTIAGFAIGHTAVAFTNPDMVPPQNIKSTVNSRGATITTYFVPEKHLPLVSAMGYLGAPEDTLAQLDALLQPMVDTGYSRNDDPLTAPVELDPVKGFDGAAVTAPVTQAAFGGAADPFSQLLSAITHGA